MRSSLSRPYAGAEQDWHPGKKGKSVEERVRPLSLCAMRRVENQGKSSQDWETIRGRRRGFGSSGVEQPSTHVSELVCVLYCNLFVPHCVSPHLPPHLSFSPSHLRNNGGEFSSGGGDEIRSKLARWPIRCARAWDSPQSAADNLL